MSNTDPHPSSYPQYSKSSQTEGPEGTWTSPRPTSYPKSFPYSPGFAKDNSIVQPLGVSDVPTNPTLMEIAAQGPPELQHGYKTVAKPARKEWEPGPDTKGKPWGGPKGRSASYRSSSEKSLRQSDRGPGGTNSY